MKARNHTIDYLRGLAALMVCLVHFRHVFPAAWRPAIFELRVGVEIFFVISGFIIPFSLHRAGYRAGDAWRFLLKRLARLQPPLMAALLVTFALSHGAAWYKGETALMDFGNFARAMCYLGVPDENPVVWTLIVEMKYYIFVALLYPLFFSRDARVRRVTFVAAAAIAAAGQGWPGAGDLRYLPLFLMGFAACQKAVGMTCAREAATLAALAAAAGVPGLTPLQIIAGAATAVMVLIPLRAKFRPGLFFGEISYSLYLLHFPIGVKLLNYALPRTSWHFDIPLLLAAFAVSVGAAWLLCKWLEKPASDWSQHIPLHGGGPPDRKLAGEMARG
ncbi:acyltransferase [Termitidicoccus mucosus]|uniref:Acyltransferase 3 domain-containing protein n=1 Tax=Termitidicoccus mucosus TaxID=1184151 RepID=A0A178IG73_9BACT|nr:hypothetical protein AW736_21180 [Opitutaceae bacterium TSB47]